MCDIIIKSNSIGDGDYMPAKLKITFKNGDKNLIPTNASSLFHGFIMEVINPNYADYLHNNSINSFSQCIYIDNDKPVWEINTLNGEAKEQIIDVLCNNVENIYLRQKDLTLNVEDKTIISETAYGNILENAINSRQIKIDIKTPISFKQNGRYINHIDLEMMFNNLIRKFESFSNIELNKCELIEAINKNVEISEYKLRSTYFHVEGIKIPAFTGTFTLKMKNYRELNEMVNALVDYGEFSGVGIKTALGMGNVRKI